MQHEALLRRLQTLSGFELREPFLTQSTPLHYACAHDGYVASVQYLMRERSNEDVLLRVNVNGHTPLHLACSLNCVKIVESLVDSKNAENALLVKDGRGRTPLHMACVNGNVSVVRALAALPTMSTALLTPNSSGETPLYVACCLRDTTTAEVILGILMGVQSVGEALLIARHTDRRTPLHTACCRVNRVATVGTLLTLSTASDALLAQDSDGCTPLHSACARGIVGAVELLVILPTAGKALLTQCDNSLTETVDVYYSRRGYGGRSKEGSTPLHLACFYAKVGIVELLLGLPTSRDALLLRSKDGCTPLQVARNQGNASTVVLLNRITQ